MVDLVQLVGTSQRFALKSLEKREMLERNKVGFEGGLAVQLEGWLHNWRAGCPAGGRAVHWLRAGCAPGGNRMGALCVATPTAQRWHPCTPARLAMCTLLRLGSRACSGAPIPCPFPPQVGRVRTEEAILSTVDHPFLATLYGTLQTGACGNALQRRPCIILL